MPKPKVVILTTGGTIVSSGATESQITGYSFNGIQLSNLITSIPSIASAADIEIQSVFNLPSSCINTKAWITLAQTVENLSRRLDISGIVVTHGTDTKEETAFFLNLILNTKKTVVMTGAMRPATAISADGPLNLLNAIRVASCSDAQDKVY